MIEAVIHFKLLRKQTIASLERNYCKFQNKGNTHPFDLKLIRV